MLQKELILRIFEDLAGKKKDITAVHIDNICKIFLGETGKETVLPYHIIAKKEYETLILQKKDTVVKQSSYTEEELLPDKDYEIPLTDGKILCFRAERRKMESFLKNHLKKHCTKCFDYDKIDSVALFRYPLAGDYLWLDVLGKKKKLSRIFIDDKVPVAKREKMIVLAEGNHVLWIPELNRCSAFYYLSEESREIIYIQEKGEGWNHERSST
mgnify:CR=1 FL=1